MKAEKKAENTGFFDFFLTIHPDINVFTGYLH
jgi:hypothetical protein